MSTGGRGGGGQKYGTGFLNAKQHRATGQPHASWPVISTSRSAAERLTAQPRNGRWEAKSIAAAEADNNRSIIDLWRRCRLIDYGTADPGLPADSPFPASLFFPPTLLRLSALGRHEAIDCGGGRNGQYSIRLQRTLYSPGRRCAEWLFRIYTGPGSIACTPSPIAPVN